jgi:hypothetical protein
MATTELKKYAPYEKVPLGEWNGDQLWALWRNPYKRMASAYAFAYPGNSVESARALNPRSRYGVVPKTAPRIDDNPTFEEWLHRALAIGDGIRDRHFQSQWTYSQGKVTDPIRWDFAEFSRVFGVGTRKRNPGPTGYDTTWNPDMIRAFKADDGYAMDLLVWYGWA